MRFKLSSGSFANDEMIPIEFTPEGKNISPGLKWTNPPKNTKAFILMLNKYDDIQEIVTNH